MVQRRALAAGIATKICNQTLRATSVTAYLKNAGTFERAATMANQSSTHKIQLYDRRSDEVTLDEVEKVLIRTGTWKDFLRLGPRPLPVIQS